MQPQSQQSRKGYGHFVSAPPLAAEEDDEEADLEGGLYAHKKSKSGTHSNEGASDSCRNPSSLSRTSASTSDRAHHHQPIPNPGGPKSKQSQSRSRSNTSSQSPSLPSPSSPVLSDTHGQAQIVSPSTVEQGQGFFDLENDLPVREEGGFPRRTGGGAFPVGRIGAPHGGFSITGFAGKGNGGGEGGKRSRDFGAFLAGRGDEEGKGRVERFTTYIFSCITTSSFTPDPLHIAFLSQIARPRLLPICSYINTMYTGWMEDWCILKYAFSFSMTSLASYLHCLRHAASSYFGESCKCSCFLSPLHQLQCFTGGMAQLGEQ